MSTRLSTTLFSALLCLGAASGCVPSFRGKPALAFQDIPYTAVDGTAWPVKKLALPEATRAFGLPSPLQIAYVELNPTGKVPVVFIHGLGSNLKFWRYQLDELAKKGHRVVALDLPGYGKSDKPASFPYTMESFADVVREATRALGIERPLLVGHSMGGHTALSYAIRFPDEPLALVLTSPAGFEEFSRRDKEWFKRVVTVRFIKSADEYRIWGSIRHSNFHGWDSRDTWLVEERARLAKSPEFDQYAYANVKSIHGLTETDFIRKNLGRIKAPTVIVYGDRDALIPNPFLHGGFTSDIMKFGHEGIAGSKLVELSGCGHTVQMDCADRYNEAVLAFIAGVEKTAPPPGKAPSAEGGAAAEKAAAEKAAAEKAAAEKAAAEKAAAEKAAFDRAVAEAVAERLADKAEFEKAVAAAVAERLAADRAREAEAAAQRAAEEKAAKGKVGDKPGPKKGGSGQPAPAPKDEEKK